MGEMDRDMDAIVEILARELGQQAEYVKNVVQLLDESGNVTKTYEYDSFGNEVKPEKKDENPYRYCGEYYDKENIEKIAAIPSRDTLISKFMGSIQSPIANFARVVAQIAEQKEA